MDTRDLFRIIVKEKASDLILKAGACPAMRVQGRIKFISETKIPDAFADALVSQVLSPKGRKEWGASGRTSSASAAVSASSSATSSTRSPRSRT
jgi:Tfp pilus assembly pilus retraction ATPase PilT